jgi:hypothetical protein
VINEDLLRRVAPELTAYGVLLTVAIFVFKIAIWFRTQETELGNQHLTRIKEMMLGFRHLYVEPILEQQLRSATMAAYDRAATVICETIHRITQDSSDVTATMKRVDSITQPHAVADHTEPLKRDAASLESFLLTKSGEDFLSKIDVRYSGQRVLIDTYSSALGAVRLAFYSASSTGVLLLLGMLHLVTQTSPAVTVAWVVAVTEAILFASFAFARFEVLRARLRKHWEAFEIYGDVH